MKIQTERLVVGGVALLAGLLLGWMLRGVTTYNSKLGNAGAYDDWRLACPASSVKDASCEMVSDVVDQSNGTPNTIARITITEDNKAKKVIMGFTLPLGVALEPGVGIQIGKDPVKVYQYRTCTSVGCIAVTDFDDKLDDGLKGADDAHLLFAGLDGKPISMPISLKGYGDARRAYKGTEARRHNWFWRLFS